LSKKTVNAILKSGADYVLSVKKNQPDLYDCIERNFEYRLNDKFEKRNNPLSSDWEPKMGHGRTEIRTAYVDYDVDWCESAKMFKNCAAFAMVVKKCEEKGKKTLEKHYFICSKAYSPQQILRITSQEWGVEALHWSLDNTLGEDRCTFLSKSKLINSNIVRKIALAYVSFLVKVGNVKDTIRGFMKFLSFSPEMLLN
jgi:predicted transposase YbfD/YdcC